MQTEVTVWLGQEQLQKLILPIGEYVIGRDDDSHILIDLDDVSRRHAKIDLSTDGVTVKDLGSSCGTVIGGTKIESEFRSALPQLIKIGSAIVAIEKKGMAHFKPKQVKTQAPRSNVAASESPMEALRSGSYRIGQEFGRGSMGAIHLAEDSRLGRAVAMKVVLGEQKPPKEMILRFIREAQVMAQLDHPNIVPIYELGVNSKDQIFYAMKFVKGVTLHEVISQIGHGDLEMIRKYHLVHLLTIFQKVCDAVAYAHSKGILHRDLKPENIMIGEFGQVLVMDWGLAMIRSEIADEPEAKRPTAAIEAAELSATILGDIMGTPQFMAPEQAEGKNRELDERTDIFALGGILYNILTLQPPFVADSFVELLEMKKQGYIPPPIFFNRPRSDDYYGESGHLTTVRKKKQQAVKTKKSKKLRKKLRAVSLPHCPGSQIPESLSQIAMTALATDPDHRYPKVGDLQKDLVQYQNGLITLIAQHKLAAVGVGVAVLLLITVVLNIRHSGKVAREKLESLHALTPSLYENALELYKESELIRARELMEHAVSIEPEFASHHLLLGKIYFA
ncbi:FHA domain-containing serine/threonine-protein kinase, partial [Verrucomicrobia bacterium]|nr:FHA domain-containing serine/threonine-protein kinase [Verrucomicrobiota bacterium]